MKRDELEALKSKLPSIPSINGKDEYYNSVVLVLLTLLNDEYHIVFEKRCKDIRQGGEICLPGGMYEKEQDASLEMTALRETREELGISADKIEIIGRLDTVVALMGTTVDAFVGVTGVRPEEMKINPEEVERVFTLAVSYFQQTKPEKYQVMTKIHPSYIDVETRQEVVLLPAAKLGLPERYRKPWGGFRHKVLVYQTVEGVIWGITARIIYDLVSRAQGSKE